MSRTTPAGIYSVADHGHHTQTSLWGQIKASMGWQAVRVTAQQRGLIVGGAQILMRRLPVGGNVGFVSRGPVLAGPDAAVAGAVMDEIERVARRLGFSPPHDPTAIR